MLRIGLTGSIATGKSTILSAFADLGVPVFSSDEAVHRLYEGEAVAPVGAAFPGVVKDGRIDRTALSKILVAEPARMVALEAIVHPLVRREIADFLEDAAQSGAALAVVDIPLLFESGYDYGLDAVAITVCDPAIQRARALARPGMTVEKLETILARQMPQDEKMKRATYVFDTNGEVEATRRKVKALVDAFAASNDGKS
jgi:dephospho-CoA kinase